MNNFEGINTGKWLVKETLTDWEAECTSCGCCIPLAVNFDIASLTTKVHGLEDHCPSCNENMFIEESKLFTEKAPFVVGQLEPSSKSVVINCEKISLEQRSLGIVIDISERIDNIDTVEINGIKFTREV